MRTNATGSEQSVDVVLPCLNEAAALPGVLAGLPSGWRAIVVDNGSSDGSAEVARVRVFHWCMVVNPLTGSGWGHRLT